MAYRLIIFFALNFAALGIGTMLMGDGASSDWYEYLNKPSWTPHGWIFGVAWITIMICFSIYMTFAWEAVDFKSALITLFVLQWFLNVSWSPVFFKYHQVLYGLIVVIALTLLIGYMLFTYMPKVKWFSLFIFPYFLWLLVATSLNAYIYLRN